MLAMCWPLLTAEIGQNEPGTGNANSTVINKATERGASWLVKAKRKVLLSFSLVVLKELIVVMYGAKDMVDTYAINAG